MVLPSPPIPIEPMGADDVPAVAALEGAGAGREESLHAELARPWSHAWVVRGDTGAAIAYLLAWHVVDEIHLLDVATRADMRRRGFGRALLQHLVTFAREARARHVLLEVRRSNAPAIALYRSMGFFAFGIRARYYPDDEDAVEMMLAFDALTGEVSPHSDDVPLGTG